MPEEQPTEQPQLGSPVSIPPSSGSIKKPLFIALALCLLLAAAAAAYFLIIKKDRANDQVQTNTPELSGLSASAESLYFQVNSKIYAYDTAAREAKVLYDKLPEGARVLDFYRSGSDWRAYYLIADEADTVIYLNKNGEATELVKTTDNYPIADASAEAQVLAYSLLPINEDDLTRTYTVAGTNKPELVYESDPYTSSDSEDTGNLKHALYHLSEMSPDGSKLLFSRSQCYQCDGASPGYFAELDIASKQIAAVDLGDVKAYRSLRYARDGSAKFYLQDSDDVGMLGGIGDYEGFAMRISRFTDPAQKTVVFEESNTTWANAAFSPDHSLLAVNEYKDPADWQSQYFRGFYELKGTQVDQLQRREVAVPEKVTIANISDELNGCVALVTERSHSEEWAPLGGVAVSCRDEKGVYGYEFIDEIKESDTYLSVKLL